MTSRSTKPHDRHRAVRARLSAVAALVASFTVLSSGIAAAAWWASDSASSSAGAATVDVQLAAGSLDVTYSSSILAKAAAVTVTNGSSREGDYSLAIAATSGSPAYRGAVAMGIVEVSSPSACTVTTPISGPSSATSTFTSGLSKTGTLAPAEDVTYCVITSMTSGSIATHANAPLAASITAGITVGTWIDSDSAAFTQSVAAPAGITIQSGARYLVKNANQCTNGGHGTLIRNNDCDYNRMGQFRITEVTVGSGIYYIAGAKNESTQFSAPRWRLASSTANIVTATPSTSTEQQWRIVARPDGAYRIENVLQGTCAEVSNTYLWNSPNNIVVGAPCDNTRAAQAFQFELYAPHIRPIETLVCSGNGSNYIQYGWTKLTGYEAEVTYRVLVNNVFVINYTNGHHPFFQLNPSQVPAGSIPNGTHVVELQQSVAGDPWATTAYGTIVISGPSNNRSLACG